MRPILAPLVATLALLTAGPALAAEKFAEDCTAAERDRPTLEPGKLADTRFRMVVSDIGFERGPNGETVRLKLRHGEETATLSGGVMLLVSLGGCEDYSNTYEFQFPGDRTPLGDSRYWLTRASRLLAEIAPANREKFVRLPALGAVLARQAKTSRVDLTEGLEGGLDESHRYLVTLSRRGETTLLTVAYIVRL